MQFIDCKSISAFKREDIKRRLDRLKEKYPCFTPSLTIITVGDDDASRVYTKNKVMACSAVGIQPNLVMLPYQTTTEELLDFLMRRIEMNSPQSYTHGIIVQLPLPNHIDADIIFDNLNVMKDVDCLSTFNYGSLMSNAPRFTPCTPQGIMDILKNELGDDFTHMRAVVIGRSKLVGHPIATLLTKANATVTLCHSKTHPEHLQEYLSTADIVVCAVGKANFLNPEWVKDGAIIIDVGINRNKDGHLCGDVDHSKESHANVKCTPVPGGVGIMTVTSLLNNTAIAFERYCEFLGDDYIQKYMENIETTKENACNG